MALTCFSIVFGNRNRSGGEIQLDNLDLSSDSWMALCLLQSTLLLHRQLLKESLEVADAGGEIVQEISGDVAGEAGGPDFVREPRDGQGF